MTTVLLSSAQATLAKTGFISSTELDVTSQFILLNGWAAATTRQYAAAVNKLLLFSNVSGIDLHGRPLVASTLYQFILWCSTSSKTNVSTSTIKRYLTGLRMWHALHDAAFPSIDANRVRLLLKSCSKTESRIQSRQRTGLNLRDILDLSDRLTSSNLNDLVTKAVILTAFWGLARLGELTLNKDHPAVFLRRKDVKFSIDGTRAHLHLRMAKTAKHGEIQLIRLQAQPNRLDPINVLRELLTRIHGRPDDPLFPDTSGAVPISRSQVARFLKANGPQDTYKWGGHSLRIGGASFQHASGRSVDSLKRLGRWKSSAYKSYVRRYSPVLHSETMALLSTLHF